MNVRPLGAGASANRTSGAIDGLRGRQGALFQMPGGTAEASAAAPVVPLGLDGLLSLQEVEPATERDARSRSRGEALLAALSRLQHQRLRGEADTALLEHMTRLCQHLAPAADPGLREAVAAITLRVHVELARQHTQFAARQT